MMPLAHVKCFIHFFYLFSGTVAYYRFFCHLFKVDLLNVPTARLRFIRTKIKHVQKSQGDKEFQPEKK